LIRYCRNKSANILRGTHRASLTLGQPLAAPNQSVGFADTAILHSAFCVLHSFCILRLAFRIIKKSARHISVPGRIFDYEEF